MSNEKWPISSSFEKGFYAILFAMSNTEKNINLNKNHLDNRRQIII
ncbi:hypothetical protein D1AOALGA4SA_43 [Olavius algarvensis Delta 1 endosymbiont]|nr:hypothetical protein D1AOALGA4SA_43 [Olavius algarvensis Delta 1 endosymbiont]